MEKRRLLVTLVALAVLFVSAANAENIYLTTKDGSSDQSSFLNNDLDHWNNGVGTHPVAGNDYFVVDGSSAITLRTPTGGTQTFAGNSLTVGNLNGLSDARARLWLQGGTTTVNNLIFTESGWLEAGGTGNNDNTLAGNITLVKSTIQPSLVSCGTNLRYSVGTTLLYITANMTGDGDFHANGAENSYGTVHFRGQNTYTGSTTVSIVDLSIDSGGSHLLDINDATNSDIHGGATPGSLFLDGKINLDVSDVTLEEGSWTLFDVGTLSAVTYQDDFLIGLNGGGDFTGDAGVWSLVDGQRGWTFTESTGVLSLAVVPEPATMGLLLAGGLGVVLRHKRR